MITKEFLEFHIAKFQQELSSVMMSGNLAPGAAFIQFHRIDASIDILKQLLAVLNVPEEPQEDSKKED